jgi:hypothetical protein
MKLEGIAHRSFGGEINLLNPYTYPQAIREGAATLDSFGAILPNPSLRISPFEGEDPGGQMVLVVGRKTGYCCHPPPNDW